MSEACNRYVPRIDLSLRRTRTACWMNNHLKGLVRKKQDLRYFNCTSNWGNKDKVLEYRTMCKQVKREIYRARREYELGLISRVKDDPKILLNTSANRNQQDSILKH